MNEHNNNLADIFGINKNYFVDFFSLLSVKNINKSEFILQAGDVCNYIGIVIEGSLRTYYINENGEDVSFLFHFNHKLENLVFTDYESVLLGNKSKLNIQALENSTVFLLSKNDLESLYLKDIYWQNFGKRMTERIYLSAKKRVEDLLYYSPEKRYLNLLTDNPLIFQKIPQKFIASYLGITPQSLSRIRKRITIY
ncbi:MAG: Crp/Fnr family transcriptional regulator [Bacteroidales bacterium]|nr:Crp/Fnr family transcriptional regulator [Bacteroidales bacterium]